MTTRALQPPIRLLVVNPNSSQSMTGGVEEAIEASGISEVRRYNVSVYSMRFDSS